MNLEAELDRLEEAARRAPEDVDALVALAGALARAGFRARAFARLLACEEATASPRAAAARAAMVREPLPAREVVAEVLPALELTRGKRVPVTALAVDPEKLRLACGLGSGEIWILPLAGAEPPWYLGTHRFGTSALAFSGDGASLASGGGDKQAVVWDLGARAPRLRISDLHGRVLAVQSWQGRLAVATRDEARLLRPEPVRVPLGCPQAGLPYGLLAEGKAPEPFAPPPDAAVLAHEPGGPGRILVGAGKAEAPGPAGRTRWRDPCFYLPRGIEYRHAPALALAPGAQALALGSSGKQAPIDPDVGPRPRGARPVLLEDPPVVFDLLPGEIVTSVAFSPSGGLLLLGTSRGTIHRATLRASRPSPPGPERDGAVRSLGTADLAGLGPGLAVETGTSPWFDPARLAPLARLGVPDRTRKRPWTSRPQLALTAQAAYLALDPFHWPGDEPDREVLRFDLGSGASIPVGWAGFPDRSDVSRSIAARLARAVADLLEARIRLLLSQPEGTWAAAVAHELPSDLLLVDTANPASRARLRLPARIAALAWSPRGTRVAALLHDTTVWILGSG